MNRLMAHLNQSQMQPGANSQPPFRQMLPPSDRVPPWVLDLLLGLAVALVVTLVISARQGGSHDPDALAYLFAGGFGALMLVRRRFPVAVLVGTMLLLFAYYPFDYPAIGLAVPVFAALYSAAELGHLAASMIVSLLLILVSTYFRLHEETLAYLGYELISTVTLMAAAIALGDGMHSRRALRAEQEQMARMIEQEQAFRAEQRVQAERVRVARDLHDVIGHSITVISLHADVAREAIGSNDEEARQALARIREASSDTMRELRATLKLLRSPTGDQPDQPDWSIASLTNLSTLVDRAAASGLRVDVGIEGELTGLPTAVDTAAYRIIQESLTNVIRHANATHVTLTIAANTQELRLCLTDDGVPSWNVFTPGSGIAGMMERARLLDGSLTAQPRPAGGFEVDAVLPLTEAP